MYGRCLAPAALGPAAGSGGHLRRILGVYGHTPAARPGVWGLRPGVRKFSGQFLNASLWRELFAEFL
jgi:hypothetical protein